MDLARYKMQWYYLCTAKNLDEINYIQEFRRNLSKSGFVVAIVDESGGDHAIGVYFYLFTDEQTYIQFMRENDYENTKFQNYIQHES